MKTSTLSIAIACIMAILLVFASHALANRPNPSPGAPDQSERIADLESKVAALESILNNLVVEDDLIVTGDVIVGGSVQTDAISEFTPDSGVDVDGVLHKDGAVSP